MTEPLVSIKMITYNHAHFIAKAIEGVLNQKTDFPFELVIGEDCSTDGTREIVFEYQKRYPDIIRVVTSDKNVGIRQNGYRTMMACRGKYIAFCEGDDYWQDPSKLQKQVEHMESNPDCGLICSSYDVYHVKSGKLIKDFINYRKWEIPKNPSISDIIEGKVGMGIGILTCTVMIRRNHYEQLAEADPYLHQSDHFMMGDTQLWAEIATLAHVHYIPESLATHTITDESVTRSKDVRKVLRFGISNAELLLYLCDKYKLPSNIRNKIELSWCEYTLRFAFHTRSAKLADEMRRKKKAFTWREWLLYSGAKNLAYYYLFRIASLFLNIFRENNYDLWT